jgi:predicted dehydrogenase
MSKYRAVVIGLGKVGMGYDYSCHTNLHIMTHASAYYHHPGFSLIAGIDPDPNKRELFTQKYNTSAYASISEMGYSNEIDVCSIATPTSKHESSFYEVLQLQPKSILCEKPFSHSITSALKMRDLANKNNIILFVNYMRQFEPGVQKIKALLFKGILGHINKIFVKYSKSFLNSATHFLSLIQYLFGSPITNLRSDSGDGCISCCIGSIVCYFISVDSTEFDLYEMQIIGSMGILNYEDAGRSIYYRLCSEDKDIDHAITLNNKYFVIENDFNRFQWHVVDTLYRALLTEDVTASNVDLAIETLRVAGMLNLHLKQ